MDTQFYLVYVKKETFNTGFRPIQSFSSQTLMMMDGGKIGDEYWYGELEDSFSQDLDFPFFPTNSIGEEMKKDSRGEVLRYSRDLKRIKKMFKEMSREMESPRFFIFSQILKQYIHNRKMRGNEYQTLHFTKEHGCEYEFESFLAVIKVQ